MTTDIELLAGRLLDWYDQFNGVLVAFSGGVDSAVVAKAAFLAIGSRSKAVTADSPSLSRYEFAQACELAKFIGIPHLVVLTDEILDADYVRNDSQRCFHCKSHLFASLRSISQQLLPEWVIVTGTNSDDLSDFRPGLRAAAEFKVLSPLAELAITKAQVRQLAEYWQLPVSDKPASPCLASRIAYGVEVTPQRLQMVEMAETIIRELGVTELRVRVHAGDVARIEVSSDWIAKLVDPTIRGELTCRIRALGFNFVTIDLEGFRSGNLNQLIKPIEIGSDRKIALALSKS